LNIPQTVEAEVKAVDAPTESPGGWDPGGDADCQMDCRGHGQRRRTRRVFHDVTHTLVARDMLVSCEERGFSTNQGGTADRVIRP